MPRFEDLLDGQGRIRLRTRLPVMDRVRLFGKCLHAVQRGWVLYHGQISHVTELYFRPVPEGVDERGRMFTLDVHGGTIQAHQRYAEADFDAILAALEPYEVVMEPVIHYAPYGPNAIGGFDCGNKSDRNNLFTGHPCHVTCDGCKRASPGLWPEVVEADTPLEVETR